MNTIFRERLRHQQNTAKAMADRLAKMAMIATLAGVAHSVPPDVARSVRTSGVDSTEAAPPSSSASFPSSATVCSRVFASSLASASLVARISTISFTLAASTLTWTLLGGTLAELAKLSRMRESKAALKSSTLPERSMLNSTTRPVEGGAKGGDEGGDPAGAAATGCDEAPVPAGSGLLVGSGEVELAGAAAVVGAAVVGVAVGDAVGFAVGAAVG